MADFFCCQIISQALEHTVQPFSGFTINMLTLLRSGKTAKVAARFLRSENERVKKDLAQSLPRVGPTKLISSSRQIHVVKVRL